MVKGFTQVSVRLKTAQKLEKIKIMGRHKSMDRVIDKLIDKYNSLYADPKNLFFEKHKELVDQFHYMLTKDDYELFGDIPAMMRGGDKVKIELLEKHLQELKNRRGQSRI